MGSTPTLPESGDSTRLTCLHPRSTPLLDDGQRQARLRWKERTNRVRTGTRKVEKKVWTGVRGFLSLSGARKKKKEKRSSLLRTSACGTVRVRSDTIAPASFPPSSDRSSGRSSDRSSGRSSDRSFGRSSDIQLVRTYLFTSIETPLWLSLFW